MRGRATGSAAGGPRRRHAFFAILHAGSAVGSAPPGPPKPQEGSGRKGTRGPEGQSGLDWKRRLEDSRRKPERKAREQSGSQSAFRRSRGPEGRRRDGRVRWKDSASPGTEMHGSGGRRSAQRSRPRATGGARGDALEQHRQGRGSVGGRDAGGTPPRPPEERRRDAGGTAGRAG